MYIIKLYIYVSYVYIILYPYHVYQICILSMVSTTNTLNPHIHQHALNIWVFLIVTHLRNLREKLGRVTRTIQASGSGSSTLVGLTQPQEP